LQIPCVYCAEVPEEGAVWEISTSVGKGVLTCWGASDAGPPPHVPESRTELQDCVCNCISKRKKRCLDPPEDSANTKVTKGFSA
jgi:hypothetical protein